MADQPPRDRRGPSEGGRRRDPGPGRERPSRPGRPAERATRPERRDAQPRRPETSERPASRPPRAAEPPLPDDVTAADLDPAVRRELRSLAKAVADRVGAHLAAAGRLVDEDPAAALAHARYARDQASRIAATREAVGIAAYLAGEYAEALAELRAHRRMSGSNEHLAVMADAERGLGRPERALALARDPAVGSLDRGGQVEMRIVESGARRDLGEAQAAVVTLQIPQLDSDRLEPWTARLWYAYAEALLAAGRRELALDWFRSAATVDEEGETDAEERVAELEG